MPNQPQAVTHQRTYTRNDFAALRAFVQRVSPEKIGRLYLGDDEDGYPLTAAAVERRLRDMQADLVALAIEHGSPVLADHLKASAKKHGSARLAAASLKMVEQAAQLAVAAPAAEHSVGMWFRPLVAERLKSTGVTTLAELVTFCNARGGSWWRAVPRIGAGRARLIVGWLRRHEATLGLSVEADVDLADPLAAPDAQIIEIGQRPGLMAPLERMALAHPLAGSDGLNRASLFPYIQAHNDLEAVRAYLYQYRDQPKTLRAYTKELERFVLWAVLVRRKPMSSLLVDDCEAYKEFLKAPDPGFVGSRTERKSPRWRPFAADALSPESQRYAVRVLRAAFEWLIRMRYLAGNPWVGVKDPIVVKLERDMRIERAIPAALWERIRDHVRGKAIQTDATCDQSADAPQWRICRALMLLMGDSGLRREEAAGARRETLKLSQHASIEEPVWQLQIIGKRNRQRTVPVSPETIEALRAHWHDRGEEFERSVSGPLLSPLLIPPTKRAQAKHEMEGRQPYSVSAINRLIDWMRLQLVVQLELPDNAAHVLLGNLTPHSFRHTFGTQAVAEKVPLDVVQKILGHQSLQTTSIYVQAEEQRMMQEAVRYYQKRSP